MSNKIKIYGERNTGTNYLTRLVELNLKAEILPGTVPSKVDAILRRLPKSELLRDAYFNFKKANLGWKHRELDEAFLNSLIRMQPEVKFLTLTKNPYSWLLSLYNRPYHYFNNKENMSFSQFLQTEWQSLGRENEAPFYTNPIEIWNKKNEAYINLNQHFDVVSLTYEDFLINPIEQIEKIQSSFQFETKEHFPVNFEKSTKDSQKNADYYRDYYMNEKWRDKLDDESIEIIKSNIDQKWLNFIIIQS